MVRHSYLNLFHTRCSYREVFSLKRELKLINVPLIRNFLTRRSTPSLLSVPFWWPSFIPTLFNFRLCSAWRNFSNSLSDVAARQAPSAAVGAAEQRASDREWAEPGRVASLAALSAHSSDELVEADIFSLWAICRAPFKVGNQRLAVPTARQATRLTSVQEKRISLYAGRPILGKSFSLRTVVFHIIKLV